MGRPREAAVDVAVGDDAASAPMPAPGDVARNLLSAVVANCSDGPLDNGCTKCQMEPMWILGALCSLNRYYG